MKLGPLRRFVPGVSSLIVAASSYGCGYHSAVASVPSSERLAVAAAPFSVPYAEAAAEALNGARAQLSRAGALGSAAFPRFVVEVVRVDELPAAIAAPGGQAPLGRGSDVGVTVHGWVEEREGGQKLRDTGDVRRVETVVQTADAMGSSLSVTDAIRAAARHAGEGAAARALGMVEPSIEPM
ncbi:MAG TPA: hypothetical protein VH062_17460 [Polyangiaceae bacterium]|nr:hypothetical protein [Polyangiaceae bacterium]